MGATEKVFPKIASQRQKAGYTVTFLSIFFYGVGFVLDLISYYSDQLWFLFFINLPVILVMLFSAVYLIYNKKIWSTILVVIYVLIIINLILSVLYRAINQVEISHHIMVDMLLGLVIVVTSAYTLKIIWTYLFSLILSAAYLFVTLYSQEVHLMGNIVLVPLIMVGTAFVTHSYIHLVRKAQKIAIETEDEANKLYELMKQDRQRINNALEQLSVQVAKSDIQISDNIKQIVQTLDYELPEVVLEYTEKITSDENLFFNRLLKINPNLSSNELKLCYMLVNNMSSKEIANATSRTPNSVKVFRSRLRKKLDLEPEINLVSFLKKVEIGD
ncbi:hypothetical protein GM418_08795 [Maribellus comscasis]|uniref:HTH luxR-type domain-containing protein n=1 Tax=Maribellus comscasis TaxID=2681766 RepID=A0A6I6JUB9_9BACT|nr:LuxR C-terminal-related transcriptional regulator [Maribellus comscasis]QGY43752.1 hypothetical protein GM418_08795 [Maribellus comscasis]